MSPTVRVDREVTELDRRRDSRPPRSATAYSWTLLAIACAAVLALAASGQPWPALAPLLALSVPLVWCTNRFVVFPNETGVTADAAVIVASMVVFHDDATWLGPLVVALSVGSLDIKHWRDRAFVRMAFNSGSTTLVAAVAVLVFHASTTAFGDSWSGLLGAAVVAAVPYVIAESVFGVLLMTMLGERPTSALRHQLPLHALAVPLAAWGAIAGVAGAELGWWAALVVLLPVPLVPELLIVVLPRRRSTTGQRVLVAATAGVATTVLVATAMVAPGTGTTLAALGALAALAGLEGRLGIGLPAPPLVVVPVAAAIAVPNGGATTAVAVALVVAVATASSWWREPTRRTRWSDLGWCVPVGAAAVLAAALWLEAGRVGAILFGLTTTVVLVAGAAWGSPPWGSRSLGRWAFRHAGPVRRPVLVASVAAALVCVVLGAALVAGLCVQAALAMAAIATRQWRFAPDRRRRDGVVVALASIACAAAVLLAGPDTLVSLVVLSAACALASMVAWPLALGSARVPADDD